MKFKKSYLLNHKNSIENTLYGVCLSDSLYTNSEYIFQCQKSSIYKLTTDQELVIEIKVNDPDKNYFFEERKIKLNDIEYSNFYIIGNILDLADYIENTMVIPPEED